MVWRVTAVSVCSMYTVLVDLMLECRVVFRIARFFCMQNSAYVFIEKNEENSAYSFF